MSASLIKGIVKFFNEDKGFGFIKRDDGEKDVFVHINAVHASGIDDIVEGDAVIFDIEDGARGQRAANIKMAPA